MTQYELIVEIARKADITQKEAKAVLNATVSTITEHVSKGDKVCLYGFGTFQTKTRPAHTGLNPRTHEKVEIPERTRPIFLASKGFKDIVN